MHSIFKKLQELTNDELLELSEVLDGEIESRTIATEEIPDSARRRAVQRSKSYRHRTGSAAPPVRYTGLKEQRRKRKFAA
ncbi:MAG: hypothetical protein JXB10_08955 [Pirellulales bacterium]|nr:hypothetical protein [Pirellulales bacterium]